MGRGDNYVKLTVKKFPKTKWLVGDHKTNWSPLDAFFAHAVGTADWYNDAIYFQPKKVHVSPHDSKVLYGLFKGFVIQIHGLEQGATIAADVWLRMGPTVNEHVLKGHIFLEHDVIGLVE